MKTIKMGRYIHAKIRKLLEAKFGNHCAFPGCRNPWYELHHTKRFSLTKRHLPDELVPLCKIHHELAHVGVIKNEHLETSLWDLDLCEKKNGEIAKIDDMVIVYKRKRGLKPGRAAVMVGMRSSADRGEEQNKRDQWFTGGE